MINLVFFKFNNLEEEPEYQNLKKYEQKILSCFAYIRNNGKQVSIPDHFRIQEVFRTPNGRMDKIK